MICGRCFLPNDFRQNGVKRFLKILIALVGSLAKFITLATMPAKTKGNKMEITKTRAGSNTSGKLVVLTVKGTQTELEGFEMSLFNWNVVQKEEQFFRPNNWTSVVRVPVEKLLEYWANLELMRFDADRIILPITEAWAKARAMARFESIIEVTGNGKVN
jgi:virulence-associated protein VagC